jgi:hypothetical protein
VQAGAGRSTMPCLHKALFFYGNFCGIQSQSKQIKMAKQNLSELSTEDLIKKKKTLTFVTGILAGMLIVLLIITIFQTISEGFKPLIAVPFGLLPILILSYNQVSSMDKELKSRNSN